MGEGRHDRIGDEAQGAAQTQKAKDDHEQPGQQGKHKQGVLGVGLAKRNFRHGGHNHGHGAGCLDAQRYRTGKKCA